MGEKRLSGNLFWDVFNGFSHSGQRLPQHPTAQRRRLVAVHDGERAPQHTPTLLKHSKTPAPSTFAKHKSPPGKTHAEQGQPPEKTHVEQGQRRGTHACYAPGKQHKK